MTEVTEFRFMCEGRPGVYHAVRQDALWRVTLEGNSSPWLFWMLSDEHVRKDFWDGRLTD